MSHDEKELVTTALADMAVDLVSEYPKGIPEAKVIEALRDQQFGHLAIFGVQLAVERYRLDRQIPTDDSPIRLQPRI